MTVLLPYVGVTGCIRALSLLTNHPAKIVGTFWLMDGYGFENRSTPGWWLDTAIEENPAQALLDHVRDTEFLQEHENPLYLGFCIIVVGDLNRPANFDYVVQHLRMCNLEGVEMLEILAEHSIPARAVSRGFGDFVCHRPEYPKDTYRWTAQHWEDFCSYLLSVWGESMLTRFWGPCKPL